MVTVGETVTLAPVSPPGFHVYAFAPVADILAAEPIQIEEDAAVKTTVGVGFTRILTVPGAVEIQPTELVPEIEYVVVTVGHTAGPAGT